MVVRFTWKPQEWRELYLLSTVQAGGSGGVPMAYLVVALMVTGGVSDVIYALRRNRDAILHDRLLPALLLVAVLTLLTAVSLRFLRRRSQLRGLPALPGGEQQVTLHELGWSSGAGYRVPPVRGWSDLHGLRKGRGILTLLTRDGVAVGLPLRALSGDQQGWVDRLLLRKLPRLLEAQE